LARFLLAVEVVVADRVLYLKFPILIIRHMKGDLVLQVEVVVEEEAMV
jgi:hypothetical protein